MSVLTPVSKQKLSIFYYTMDMASQLPLPEEDILLYISQLKKHRLPVPVNEFEFLRHSPKKDTKFIRIYGPLAVEIAEHWYKSLDAPKITLSDAVERANAVLLASREQFLAYPGNRARQFSQFAAWFIQYELDKLR